MGSVPTHGLADLPGLQSPALAAAPRVHCPVQIWSPHRIARWRHLGSRNSAARLSVPVEIHSFNGAVISWRWTFSAPSGREPLAFLKRIRRTVQT